MGGGEDAHLVCRLWQAANPLWTTAGYPRSATEIGSSRSSAHASWIADVSQS